MILQMNTTKKIIKNSYIFLIIRMLITGGSGSGKTNALFDLIKEQDSDSKILLIRFSFSVFD